MKLRERIGGIIWRVAIGLAMLDYMVFAADISDYRRIILSITMFPLLMQIYQLIKNTYTNDV